MSQPQRRVEVAQVWPFISGDPTDEHALLLAIGKAIPRGIPEHIRQELCQDLAVEVLLGSVLNAETVKTVVKAGKRKYYARWDEFSISSQIGKHVGVTWADALSENHPNVHMRPRTEPCPSRPVGRPRTRFGPPRIYRPQAEFRGSGSPKSKLTEDQVIAMRYMYRSARHTQHELANLFGVSQTTVSWIVTGSTWKHVSGPIYWPKTDVNAWAEMFKRAGIQRDDLNRIETMGYELMDKRASLTETPITDFDKFWAAYPRKVGRLDALKAYGKARTMASAAEILAGVKNYCANLPDEERFIKHAASWLNGGRWMDEYEPAKVKPKRGVAEQYCGGQSHVDGRKECRHEPRCPSNEWHQVLLEREQKSGAA